MSLSEWKKEQLRNSITSNIYYEQIAKEKIKMDYLADQRFLQRRLHLERRESENEEAVVRSQEMKRLSAKQCLQEENLAKEMERLKHQELVDKKLRQQLRENSHELRDLEGKLKAAYCIKGLYAQFAEHEAMKIKEKADSKKAYLALEVARTKEEDFRRQQEELLIQQKYNYKKELQEQIVTSHQMKLCLYEEYLKEKKMIDDIVKKLHDEDMQELEERMLKMNRTRQEMEEFKKAQLIWRKRERDVIDEEHQKIISYLQKADNSKEEQEAKMKEKEERKEKSYNIIAKIITDDIQKKKEKEEIAFVLMEEESQHKAEEDRKAELEKMFRSKIEIRDGLRLQRTMKIEAIKKEELEDFKFRQQQLAKMAEEARLELMSDEKRRRKRLEHGRAIESMMIDRRVRRAEDMHELIKLYEIDQEEERKRLRIIEEERINILREHAADLMGFIPNGVLKPEDLQHLGILLDCSAKKV